MAGSYFYIPLADAQTPRNGECICDHSWTVHPEHGLLFWFQPFGYTASEEPSPQCNHDEFTARELGRRMHPEHAVRQVPVVFMGHAQKKMRDERRRIMAERTRSPITA